MINPSEETYYTIPEIVEVQDKKKGALVIFQLKSYSNEAKTDLCLINTFSLFVRYKNFQSWRQF